MSSQILAKYSELIERYHETLDLVSSRGLGEIDLLIAEASLYAELISDLVGEEPTILDLGSGAGLPGVVIAATLPRAKVHLVERRRRRGAFLEMAVGRLGLTNVQVTTDDVRRLSGICADVVTAQAVSTLDAVARLTRHLHDDPCYLVSRRGSDWLSELSPLQEFLATDGAGSSAGSGAAGEGTSVADEDSGGEAQPGASADSASAVAVAGERRLGRDGSLVALRLSGGTACRSSG